MSQNVNGIVAWLRQWFDDIYQEKLESGTNIKTVNNNSLLGSGNINITATANVNLQIQSVTLAGAATGAGQTTTTRATVSACPSGWNYYVVFSQTGWHNVASWSLSGTTLSVTSLCLTGTHTATIGAVIIYYKPS